MNILLYNPDNGVSRNFMPHLWMFLLQRLTPPGHKVFLIDGNARPLSEAELCDYIRENDIGLVGIGAMTRMIARAYKFAAAIRAIGVPVVMGGPHVTEVPDEPLGKSGGPRYADAIAVGEADNTWPQIVEDAANGCLKELYEPVNSEGVEVKPSLEDYPEIGWTELDLDQFNLVPKMLRSQLSKVGNGWGSFRVIPIESGRGCPYGCEFCTVTGFFGDSLRFRSDESVVNEMLRLKRRAREERGELAIFFVDDNFAINRKRMLDTKGTTRLYRRRFIKHGYCFDVIQRKDVLVLHELAETGCVPDDAKIDRHVFQACVQVVKHEDRLSRVGQVLAEFLVTARVRLIGREVGVVKTDFDNARISAQDDAATGHCRRCH
jgi:radical SAM superfamily enzyme YgiQ (UPF0313 family)